MDTIGTEVPRQRLGPADDADLLRGAVRKIQWRFLPVLTLAFIVNYMDRSCIGFAALSMNRDLRITSVEFGFASGILFLGYCLCEIPSNLMLYRVGPRRWLARIMISWGVVAVANAFVVGPNSLYIARFLLGVAEAGFFPGVAYVLSAWVPAQYRTRTFAWFNLAVPVSSLLGGPISGALLQMHGMWGLTGWQWMFIVEGLPACLLGIAIIFLIADAPQKAKWLSPAEQAALAAALQSESKSEVRSSLREALADRRVLILTGVQFGFVVGSYGVGLWLPQILSQYHLSDLRIGLWSAVPYLFASIGMLIWARLADKGGGNLVNLIGACFLAVIGLAISVMDSALLPGMIGLSIALVGVSSARAIFWTIPAKFLTGAGAAAGLAFINSVGALGGFFGPFAMGLMRSMTGSFTVGILAMGAMMCLSGLLTASLLPRKSQKTTVST